MSVDNFDITFCKGEVNFKQNDVEGTMICPVREKCHRFWTENHTKEAERLGKVYNSFFMLTDPNVLTDEGCEHFWKEN